MTKKSRIVIEITENRIKLTQSLWRINAYVLVQCAIVEIPSLKDEQIAGQLIVLSKKYKLDYKSAEVILVIPRRHIILRHLNLPSQDVNELQRMVELQAINHIPYAKEDVVVDFMMLGTGVEGYSKVLIAVIPKEVTMRFIALLGKAGIEKCAVTMSSLGIFYWAKQRLLLSEGSTVILDLDENSSEICICNKNHFFTSRFVPLGIKDIEHESYDDLFKQIDLTIDTFHKDELGPKVNSVLVCTSLEGASNLKESLIEEYNVEVTCVRIVEQVPLVLSKSFKWPKEILSGDIAMTVNLGLASGYAQEDLDLIPQEFKDTKSHQNLKKSIVRVVLVGVLAVFALGIALSLGLVSKYIHMKELKQEISKAQIRVTEAQKKLDQVNALQGALTNRIVLADVIDAIYRFLPRSASLVNMSIINGKILSIQGVSRNSVDINQMQKAMVDSPLFKNVNLDYVNKRITQDGEVNYFKMTGQINQQGF